MPGIRAYVRRREDRTASRVEPGRLVAGSTTGLHSSPPRRWVSRPCFIGGDNDQLPRRHFRALVRLGRLLGRRGHRPPPGRAPPAGGLVTWIAGLVGLFAVAIILWDAYETILLPRRLPGD